MRVVVLMTCQAILMRGFQLCQIVCIGMAVFTGHGSVLASQLEGIAIVCESIVEAIVAIVAIQAGASETRYMLLGKSLVHLTMAGRAIINIEGGDIGAVTVRAFERNLLHLELVCRQRVA